MSLTQSHEEEGANKTKAMEALDVRQLTLSPICYQGRPDDSAGSSGGFKNVPVNPSYGGGTKFLLSEPSFRCPNAPVTLKT